MAKKKINRFICALCLSLAVLLPTVVKTVHIEEQHHCEHACHHSDEHTEHETHEEHDCNSCPICRFLFFSFTEISFDQPILKPMVFPIRVDAFASREVYCPAQHSHCLRAPPLFAV